MSPEWIAFAKESYAKAAGYYKLEGQHQALRLAEQVRLNLTPAFLNGTINENQEFLRMLGYYVQGLEPSALSLWNLLDFWLEDQYGHAVLLCSELAAPDWGTLVEEASGLALEFQAHLAKNRVIRGYLRFTHPNFPAQLDFARESAQTVIRFYRMVQAARDRVMEKGTPADGIMGFMEHHLAETRYFMHKLVVFLPDASLEQDLPIHAALRGKR